MRVEFDPRLLEESVFHVMRCGGQNFPSFVKFRKESDALYLVKESAARELGFQRLNRRMFVELGIQKIIDDVVAFFPKLDAGLDRLVFVYAERRKDEEVELFSHLLRQWTAVFRVRAETLTNATVFRRLALHELSHVDDMLNPSFMYSRSQFSLTINSQQLDMVKERYRCLWDLYIDARLSNHRELPQAPRDAHELNFLRLFGMSKLTRNIFELLWHLQFSQAPSSPGFVEAAQLPERLCTLVGLEPPRDRETQSLRHFADVCALCRCPTVEWVDNVRLIPAPALELIRAKFPGWTFGQRICRQCAEIFETQSAISAAHS